MSAEVRIAEARGATLCNQCGEKFVHGTMVAVVLVNADDKSPIIRCGKCARECNERDRRDAERIREATRPENVAARMAKVKTSKK